MYGKMDTAIRENVLALSLHFHHKQSAPFERALHIDVETTLLFHI
jgi:hypothetical protein